MYISLKYKQNQSYMNLRYEMSEYRHFLPNQNIPPALMYLALSWFSARIAKLEIYQNLSNIKLWVSAGFCRIEISPYQQFMGRFQTLLSYDLRPKSLSSPVKFTAKSYSIQKHLLICAICNFVYFNCFSFFERFTTDLKQVSL